MSPEPSRLLIVDDDPELLRFLIDELSGAGHQCIGCDNGQDALLRWRQEQFDLVVLDWTLPDFSGVELCRRLRRSGNTTPVLMITARDDIDERVQALDAGVDDYLTKPFSPQELLARLRAVLRRSQPARLKEVLIFADIQMDQGTHKVTRGEMLLELAPTEFRLLRHFMQFPGRVFSREQLLDSVWGREKDVEPRTVDVHIRRLRKALNANGDSDVIRTVREVGYSLDMP